MKADIDKIYMAFVKKYRRQPICDLCNDDIMGASEIQYVKTKRGSELFFHDKCLKKLKKKSYHK